MLRPSLFKNIIYILNLLLQLSIFSSWGYTRAVALCCDMGKGRPVFLQWYHFFLFNYWRYSLSWNCLISHERKVRRIISDWNNRSASSSRYDTYNEFNFSIIADHGYLYPVACIWAFTTLSYSSEFSKKSGTLINSDIRLYCGSRSIEFLCIFFNPSSAELICKKTSQPKGFCLFEIIITVLASSFRFIWIPKSGFYGH